VTVKAFGVAPRHAALTDIGLFLCLWRADTRHRIVRTLSTNEVAHFGVPPVRVDLLRSGDGIDAESAISRAEQL